MVPVAFPLGSDGRLYMKELPLALEMTNVPLYCACAAPVMVILAPLTKPWLALVVAEAVSTLLCAEPVVLATWGGAASW